MVLLVVGEEDVRRHVPNTSFEQAWFVAETRSNAMKITVRWRKLGRRGHLTPLIITHM